MQQINPVLAESQYPLPTEAQILLVTPEMASDWLSHRTYNRNRKISKRIVGKYLTDMKAGHWKTTRQGLIFDTEGKIIDGQHRLSAVANGELTVAFWVYPDEARDNFEVLDQGYKRAVAQQLGVPNATTVAAASRFIASLSDADAFGLTRFNRISSPEMYHTVQEWQELTRYAIAVNEVRTATWIPGAPHLAVLAQAARTDVGSAEKIESWRRGLISGDNLSSTDARLQLRNRFIRQHNILHGSRNRDMVYNLIVKSWNAYAEGKPMGVLRWQPTEGMIPVSGFDWSKHNAQEESK